MAPRQKREIKFIENERSRLSTFRRRQCSIFKKADELSKIPDVEVCVLLVSPTNISYTFGKPSLINNVERNLMKELEQLEMHEELLRKRNQEELEKSKMLEKVELEDLVAFKEKLEALRADRKRRHEEMKASATLLMLSEETENKKMKIEADPREKYELQPRIPRNYVE
ncbi:hypothetical protein CARUB_v10012009mg [Capsella rubella]|uniref:MADS-box domain-containing protein n=1 Tax=Capsella rubella TaxID=81985 RepID=R0GPW6_9BRAS|nr:agamous-like MADS-box protein AGL29 [Capsella rubella]EOA37826.1 hypothetical protein CARUB_v10012009mg [Capsella rubella]